MVEIELDPEEVDAFAATFDVRAVAANLLKLKTNLSAADQKEADRAAGSGR